jgi:hypothetical protein
MVGPAVLTALAFRAAPLGAQDSGAATPTATMTCEHVVTPGRVRCEVEARVSAGHSIAWGDVVLQHMPPFAAALRGRVGPHDASVHEPSLWRWPFALVARGTGTGPVEGQVRAVVCTDHRCAAQEVTVVGQVAVGP